MPSGPAPFPAGIVMAMVQIKKSSLQLEKDLQRRTEPVEFTTGPDNSRASSHGHKVRRSSRLQTKEKTRDQIISKCEHICVKVLSVEFEAWKSHTKAHLDMLQKARLELSGELLSWGN
jgi:hypothetical protein